MRKIEILQIAAIVPWCVGLWFQGPYCFLAILLVVVCQGASILQSKGECWWALFSMAGAALNGAAVWANDWKMPVLRAAWVDYNVADSRHSLLTPDTLLSPLCDIYSVRGFGIFSLGDFIIFAGLLAYAGKRLVEAVRA